MKASIVIPVHNAESYLEECLGSIYAQSMTDFEVVCVDDGSTDGSAGILAKHAAAHSNLTVVTKECGGVSSARNAGIHAAQGDYLLFVDSDDLIYPQLLEHAIATAEQHEAEMVVFGYEDYFAKKNVRSPRKLCADETLLDRSFSLEDVSGVTYDLITPNVWRILYKRSFLMESGVRFYEDLWAAEDLAFVYETLFRAQRIALLNEILYQYRRDGGSTLTRSYRGCTGFKALSYVLQNAKDNGIDTPCNIRQFVNLLVDTTEYALRTASSYAEFNELFTEFQRSWCAFALERKDLVVGWRIPVLEDLSTLSETEYLFSIYEKRRASLERTKTDVLKLEAKVEKRDNQISSLKKKVKKLETKVESVYASKSYKIGNAIVRIPSKLKKLGKK